jgi:hypothetical protein
MSVEKIGNLEEKGFHPRDSDSSPATREILPRLVPLEAAMLAELFRSGFGMLPHDFLHLVLRELGIGPHTSSYGRAASSRRIRLPM